MNKVGELVLNEHTRPVQSVAISTDGLTLITVSEDTSCRSHACLIACFRVHFLTF
jgi:hypothetical protein